MQKIARLHGSTAMRVGHPVRNRKHDVDDVPWNRIEIVRQGAAVTFCVKACRTTQHRFNDDFKRGAGHRGCGVYRICTLYCAPTLYLTLRHRREDRHEGEQRLMSENWSYCAPLPAPVGALGEKE
jgi:hypothetical protein